MKGVVLHGGLGTRLRPLTYAGPKQLIPVANKPISQYVVEDLRDSGISEIAIIVGETFPELVKQYYRDGSHLGVKISYIYQEKPLGIAHAVGLCKDFIGDDDFVVYLGDNLLQKGIKDYVRDFRESDADAMILLKEVDDPRRFGVAKFDEDGNLVRLVEKPKEPPSKYAVIGVYMFKPVIFDAIATLKPSWRGEYEITDAIQTLIDWGMKVEYRIIDGWWFDTGKKDDVLQVNAVILDERIDREVEGRIENSRIDGRVRIEEGAEIINSHIRGPAIIGSGAKIVNSYVGPYTSIGKDVYLKDSSIEYSIVMDNAYLEGINRVSDSLIGRNAKILKSDDNKPFIRFSISDFSEIQL